MEYNMYNKCYLLWSPHQMNENMFVTFQECMYRTFLCDVIPKSEFIRQHAKVRKDRVNGAK